MEVGERERLGLLRSLEIRVLLLVLLPLLELLLVTLVEGLDHVLDLLLVDALAEHQGDLVELVHVQVAVLVLVHAVVHLPHVALRIVRPELLGEQLVELLRRDHAVEIFVDIGHDPRDRALQVGGVHTEQLEHLLELRHVHGARVVPVDDAEHLVDEAPLLVQDARLAACGGAPEHPRGRPAADVREVRLEGDAVRGLQARRGHLGRPLRGARSGTPGGDHRPGRP
mmetsp:Transcript_5505/g.14872  ORF Transcript_5505/g.14872 Transcript_5505/m.14872 type:complete len:226 (+) Transcript_5505:138-815(+)